METIIFLFLIFNIFSFSFQTIQAVFFCDAQLKEIYVIEGNTQRSIEVGYGGNFETPHVFDNLNATPGDLIRFSCMNIEGFTFGAGCFVLNNICHCYNFDTNIPRINNGIIRSYNFGDDISFNLNVLYSQVQDTIGNYNYYYEHYIPLDVNKISCQNNNNNPLILLNGLEHNIKLSDYVTANFDTKNVECRIIENYEYFSLNNMQLEPNEKFNILNDLISNSVDAKKIHVMFTNYGVILDNTKECEFYIRVCHERCSDCYDEDIDQNNHQCKQCKEGYYKVKNTYNCRTKEEMIDSIYSFSEEEKVFKICDYYFYYNTFDNNYKHCTFENSCPEGLNKIIEDKKQCISDCSLDNIYRYEFKNLCYKKCPENTVKSKTKNFYCEVKCNKENPYEIIETQKCVSIYFKTEIEKGICKLNYDLKNLNNNFYDTFLKNIENFYTSKNYNTSNLDTGNDDIIEMTKIKVILTTTENQKQNIYNDMTNINLGECENSLRQSNNLSDNCILYIKM